MRQPRKSLSSLTISKPTLSKKQLEFTTKLVNGNLNVSQTFKVLSSVWRELTKVLAELTQLVQLATTLLILMDGALETPI